MAGCSARDSCPPMSGPLDVGNLKRPSRCSETKPRRRSTPGSIRIGPHMTTLLHSLDCPRPCAMRLSMQRSVNVVDTGDDAAPLPRSWAVLAADYPEIVAAYDQL